MTYVSSFQGIKIPENCVARVREELLLMDEEVKKRRKEKEQQVVGQRLAEKRMRKLEQANKHLLANLFNLNPIHNQSLAQSLAQNQNLNQKLNQNPLQRTQSQSISQLQRAQAQNNSTLQQHAQNLPLLPLQRTHINWPNNSSTNQGPLPGAVNLSNHFSQFSPQHFLSAFPPLKNPSLPLHQTTTLSPTVASKNPLNEILDLTVSSPSPSPDNTEGGLSLDGLSAFRDEFTLESLISRGAANAQHTAQIQQQPPPLLLQQQQQLLQVRQQQESQNLLTNNHQADFLDFLDIPLSFQMSTQKASPSSSTSSCSSSASSTSSLSNNAVSHVSSSLLSTSTLIPTSSSSSLFSSPSPSSLFSNSPSSSFFSSPCLLPPAESLTLPNGHCSSDTLDVREALNSMLQTGSDRTSVIKYRQPE